MLKPDEKSASALGMFDRVNFCQACTNTTLDEVLGTTVDKLSERIEFLLAQNEIFEAQICYARSESRQGRLLVKDAYSAIDFLRQGFSLQFRNFESLLSKEFPIVRLAIAGKIALQKSLSEICIFVTPPFEHALKPHSDRYDILTLQLRGEKRWMFKDESGNWSAATIRPGQTIFVPSGVVHSVEAGSTKSVSAAILY